MSLKRTTMPSQRPRIDWLEAHSVLSFTVLDGRSVLEQYVADLWIEEEEDRYSDVVTLDRMVRENRMTLLFRALDDNNEGFVSFKEVVEHLFILPRIVCEVVSVQIVSRLCSIVSIYKSSYSRWLLIYRMFWCVKWWRQYRPSDKNLQCGELLRDLLKWSFQTDHVPYNWCRNLHYSCLRSWTTEHQIFFAFGCCWYPRGLLHFKRESSRGTW